MSRPFRTALLILAVSVARPFSASAADPAPEPGYEQLFNGKNLDGWQTARTKEPQSLAGKTDSHGGRFKVTDGVLAFDPAVKGDSYIETVRKFGQDLHIKFEFNPGAKCNNDILVRGTKFDIRPGTAETKNVKEGEWAVMEIVIQGEKMEHKINGEVVRTSNVTAAPTPLVLRAEAGAIQIRNIRVKDRAAP